MPDPVIDSALERATSALANREERPSQKEMAEAVGRAIRESRHLVVQAGTGTGKSLAYLVPALTLGTRAVVSTATKALQDQLAKRDLPQVIAELGVPVEFAVLKGRSNYICRQRVAEIASGDQQMVLGDGEASAATAPGPLGREVQRLVAWAAGAATGDRADLPWEPSAPAWSQVSIGARDCPGARRCPSGSVCFAEAARQRAAAADVVVVNTHLYTTSLASGGEVLPPHDLVVFDEAHELEDIASSAFGFDVGSGRLIALARAARPLLDDPAPAVAVEEGALGLTEVLRTHHGRPLPRPLDPETAEALSELRERVNRLLGEVRRAARGGAGDAERGEEGDDGIRARATRVQQTGTALVGDLDEVLEMSEAEVAWVEGPDHSPLLRVAPIDVGAVLTATLWRPEDAPSVVLTSATVPPRLAERLSMPSGSYEELDVGSPFTYDEQAMLYCPLHLPDPRDPTYEAAMHDELIALIEAAEGRTMALFTSWRAMDAAARVARERVPWTVLTQADFPKPLLVSRFSEEEHSCLFATMGFWQGVDVPGPSLSLVTIDRLPFPRPDDPLLQARRSQLGRRAFELIDLPRAATLLAQGVGRLIRSRSDRGVVAVLDPRLGTARYRWELVRALPPMRRTRSRDDVAEFLAPLRTRPAG